MGIDLLDFVKHCRRLAKQALGKHAGGVARWVHVVLYCIRLEEEHSYRETPNRLKYMAEIRDVLGLDRDDLPDYSTIQLSISRRGISFAAPFSPLPFWNHSASRALFH